jgi:hypothetical protein
MTNIRLFTAGPIWRFSFAFTWTVGDKKENTSLYFLAAPKNNNLGVIFKGAFEV